MAKVRFLTLTVAVEEDTTAEQFVADLTGGGSIHTEYLLGVNVDEERVEDVPDEEIEAGAVFG